MTFANHTPCAALPVPMIDAEGRDVLVVIAKGTYTLVEGVCALAEEQRPVRLGDVLRYPDKPTSSILLPSDLTFAKRGTDVIVVGDAISDSPTECVDVAVQVRGTLLPLRVHGVRAFFRGALGVVTVGPAEKFTRMPVAYELAFGGASDDLAVVELQNPCGVGVARNDADLLGKRAPQIEHPARPHREAGDRHAPVGFGAIATDWSPRRERAGTYDARWQAETMPLLPLDYDLGFGNVAHPSLQFEPHLAAGDAIGVVGMSETPISTKLPPFSVTVRAQFDGAERAEFRPPIDTVVVLPEAGIIELTARVSLPIGRGRRVLREVLVRD